MKRQVRLRQSKWRCESECERECQSKIEEIILPLLLHLSHGLRLLTF